MIALSSDVVSCIKDKKPAGAHHKHKIKRVKSWRDDTLRERESKREREREFELSNFNTRIVALEQPDFVRDKIR